MQEPEVASTLLATRDVWDDMSSVSLVNPDRQKPILAALLEQLNDGGEASVVDLVREFYATVLDPARLQMFVVGPNCHQSLVPKPSPLSEQLTSLVAQAYSGRPFPPSFVAKFSHDGVRSRMGGDGGVSQVRGCPVMSMAATDRQVASLMTLWFLS